MIRRVLEAVSESRIEDFEAFLTRRGWSRVEQKVTNLFGGPVFENIWLGPIEGMSISVFEGVEYVDPSDEEEFAKHYELDNKSVPKHGWKTAEAGERELADVTIDVYANYSKAPVGTGKEPEFRLGISGDSMMYWGQGSALDVASLAKEIRKVRKEHGLNYRPGWWK